jgi:hypothetical protein
MREYVGGGRQLGVAVRLRDFPRGIFIEKRLQRFDTLFSRDVRYVGGFDAEDAYAALLEAGEQRPVV